MVLQRKIQIHIPQTQMERMIFFNHSQAMITVEHARRSAFSQNKLKWPQGEPKVLGFHAFLNPWQTKIRRRSVDNENPKPSLSPC
jgi:hypothetical protein